MVLTDTDILKAREDGNIVIDPFDENLLQSGSIDLLLGENYIRMKSERGHNILNPYSEASVLAGFSEPRVMKTASEWNDRGHGIGLGMAHKELEGISPDDKILILSPGDRILGHTEEFIGSRQGYITSMQAKSSTGRTAILVCACAGWGDVGYINRWTMEIKNDGPKPIVLVSGRPIAQLVFHKVLGTPRKIYGDTGTYQSGSDLETIKANWKPEDMLPRLFEKSYARNAKPWPKPKEA